MKKSIAVITAVTVVAITIGMIVSAFLLSRFMLKIQHSSEKTIKVKGVAEKTITSDLAAFTCSVKIKADNKTEGYSNLDRTVKVLEAKLDSLGFTENMRSDKNITCAAMYRTQKTTEKGRTTSEEIFDHYLLTYTLRVCTSDVKLVEKNLLKIYELSARKLDISVSSAEYFISNPEQYKLELVDQASASAAERARVAARQSGSDLGPLMTARQGVIQITAPASTETSDCGTYNTSSTKKVIRMVMTMEFALKSN